MSSSLLRTRFMRYVLLAVSLLVWPWDLFPTAAAQEKPAGSAAQSPPEDTAVLTLSLPDKATLTMNGQPVAVQRKYEFQPLRADTLYTYQLRVTMPDASQRDRTLLLRGGWNVELTIPASVAARPEIMPQTGHALSIWGLAFSHDGRYLLTGAMDMSAVLWDAKTGRQLRVLRGHTGVITSVAFSPDDKHVLTGSFDGSAILWNPRTGDKVQTFSRGAAQPVWSVAFTPDGQYAVTDGVFWDVNTGANVRVFSAEGHTIRSFAFSHDGRLAASGSHSPNSTAIVWDVQTGRPRHTLSGHTNNVTTVSLSPDGRLLATGSDDRQVILWDTQTGQKLHVFGGHTEGVKSVAFHPDGRRLLSGSLDQNVIVWDAQTGRRVDAFSPRGLFPGQDKVWAITFTPDGKHALAAVGHNSAVLWDLKTKKETLRYEGATTVVGAAAFNADGRRARMVAGLWGLDWDSQTGRPVGNGFSLREIPASPITAVAFDRDARHVLVSLQDNTDHLYDVQAGRELQVFRDHAGGLFHVACSPDGRLALTGSKTPSAYLWDVATGGRHDLAGHANQPYCAAFGADGRYAVTGGFDGMAVLWDVQTRQSRQTFRTGAGVMAVAMSRDNSRVLTGGWDRSVSLWDVAGGSRLRTMTGHDNWIWTVAFSPDGRYLASGAWDNKIILWDAETGDAMRTFVGHSGWVTSVQLSPDNRYLLSASFDGTARLWDIATGDELAAMVGLNFAKDWLVITPDGLFDGSRVGREKVSFRFGGELNVVPVDRFFQDCYRPGLLSELWKGGRPAPEIRLGASQPPSVRIVTPNVGGPVEEPRVALKVEVVDQGGGVRGPWLVQNGARVQAPSSGQREGSTVRREFDVALIEGENRFEVRAASADGSWESEPGVLVLQYQQPLPKPELHLVTVGISRYADRAMQLQFARSDATAIADLFRLRSATLYRQVHVTSLADQRATKAAIVKTLREAAMKTRPQDTLLAFFAGHGTTVDSQYYFLPYEFQQGDGARAESVRQQGVPAADVGEAMAAATALRRVLVFDTGQSGLANQGTPAARNPFALRGAIERLGREEGAFTIAASAVSQQAHEVADLKHGVLTYALLAGLRAAGEGPLEKQWIEPTSEERVAHVLEWFGFASAHVPQLTSRYFGQEQDIQVANAGSSFPVLPVPATGQAPAPVAAVAAASPPKPEKLEPSPNTASKPSSRQSTAHVVAVGINQYSQKAMNLKFAAPDAKAIGDLFQSRGRTVYDNVQLNLVLDTQATRAGILAALKKVAAAAQPDDLAVLFVAGHGAMVGQRYYFIPHDFEAKTHALQEDIRSQGVPADELADAMAEIKALKQILIIDTCASGGVFELGRTLRDPMAFRTVIDRLGRRQGVFTIAAAAAGEEAQEIEQLGHGVLSYTLLAALRAVPSGPLEGKTLHPGNPRGLADVLDWFGFASGHVPRLAQRYLGKPQYVQTSGQGKSFLVLPASEQ